MPPPAAAPQAEGQVAPPIRGRALRGAPLRRAQTRRRHRRQVMLQGRAAEPRQQLVVQRQLVAVTGLHRGNHLGATWDGDVTLGKTKRCGITMVSRLQNELIPWWVNSTSFCMFTGG